MSPKQAVKQSLFQSMAVFLPLVVFLLAGIPLQAQDSATDEQTLVYQIPIHDEIFKGLIHPVVRGIDEAQQAGASLIIFDFNTPGGAVDTALELKDIILSASSEKGMETVAFVNPRAISAGALLALSTQKIFMVQSGTIGGAAPIMSTGQEMGETTEEKFISVLKSEFHSAAVTNGHDPQLAEAMVDRDLEIPGIIDKGKLLTLDAQTALDLGLAEGLAEDSERVLSTLGYDSFEIVRIEMNWAEQIARFITSPAIAGILLMVAIGGIYVEIRTPGFGVPGSLGVLAFLLLFWGHNIAGLAGMELLLIFVLGVALLSVELFITPGFGIPGSLGLLCILGSVFVMLAERMPTSPSFQVDDLLRPLAIMTFSTFGAIVTASLILVFLPKTNMLKGLFLAESTSREAGFSATEDKPQSMIGREGITVSELRPAGIADFDKERLDVVTEGDYIEAGRRVKIVRVAGRQVVVKAIR
jgi:membrane-bound serine protease (ClpP class)